MAEGGSRDPDRFYKKSSLNNEITMYLLRRTLVMVPDRTERVLGVLIMDPEYAENRSVFGQITITTRYGSQNEDMMDFQPTIESIINTVQIWPASDENVINVPSLQALARRLGPNATPFCIEILNKGPPSLVLWSDKPYDGPTVGNMYEVRVFLAEGPGDVVSKRNVVRMGIRIIYSAALIDSAPLTTPSPSREVVRARPRYHRFRIGCRPRKVDEDADMPEPVTEDELDYDDDEDINIFTIQKQYEGWIEMGQEGSDDNKGEAIPPFEETQVGETTVVTEHVAAAVARPASRLMLEKTFLPTVGKIRFEMWMDKSSFHHGEEIKVVYRIRNCSTRTVRCIKAKVIQFIDVRKFNNGTFKNVVAMEKDEENSVPPGNSFQNYYRMIPRRVPAKNWIALEDRATYPEGCLASTVIWSPEDEKEYKIYSISVSYYVKISLLMNRLGGQISLKLPLSLSHMPLHDAHLHDLQEETANRPHQEEGVYGAGDKEKDKVPIDIKKEYNKEDDIEEVDKEKDFNAKVDNNKDYYEEEDSTEVGINKFDISDEDTATNGDENSNGGNAAFGNQVEVHANPENRQYVLADFYENVIENQVSERPLLEEPPQVHADKPDEE